jgi:alpha-ketoglutarate-dependent taurine dioxygenase
VVDVHEDLAEHGFAVLNEATASVVGAELGRIGSQVVLVPREQQNADSWSLSGTYGLGAFPWHTDGAISSNPPRWLLLRAMRLSNPTCTELLDPEPGLRAGLRRTVLRATNRVGKVAYLPAAIPDRGRWRLRWDPRTCTPQAGITIEEMEQQVPTSIVEWQQGQLLIMDNTRLLHRRPAVDGQSERVLERTYVWDN